MSKNELRYNGVGRRKSSVARVILIANGSGKITVNDREVNDYFPIKTLVQDLTQPLAITETEKSFDIKVNVNGGGISGQAGAVRHGIVKALLMASEDYRKPLKEAGLITRDARVKERKKYGLKAARRSPQFSKR